MPLRPPTAPRPLPLLYADLERSGRFLEIAKRSLDMGPSVGGVYRHWHTLRHLSPPEGLTSEEWWAALKMARLPLRREIPLLDVAGRPFWFALPDEALRMIQGVNLDLGGHVGLPDNTLSPERRERYLFSSLAEEAITSSQLEGAATTRDAAKEMLRTRRSPRDEGEQMVVNNYHAMERVREIRAERLTPALVLELQRIVTDETLPPSEQGLRRPGRDDDVGVYAGGRLLHRPPPAEELESRLEVMCAFANDPGDTGPFVPPVARAILLHFWLAYDHPFVDGNGRTARALFYWGMLNQGFWLAEYLSISRIIYSGKSRYGRSFLYTESDGNDVTYFLLNQLRVVERSIEGLKAFVQRKGEEMQRARALLRPDASLNHRQVALLGHALKHPGRLYTVKSHQTSHGVSTLTARKDLLGLVGAGFLEQRRLPRRGGPLGFTAPRDLPDRLAESG